MSLQSILDNMHLAFRLSDTLWHFIFTCYSDSVLCKLHQTAGCCPWSRKWRAKILMTTPHVSAVHWNAHTHGKTCIPSQVTAAFKIQGGSNMTGKSAACLHTNQSRSCLNHLVFYVFVTYLQTQILQQHNSSVYTATYLHKFIWQTYTHSIQKGNKWNS